MLLSTGAVKTKPHTNNDVTKKTSYKNSYLGQQSIKILWDITYFIAAEERALYFFTRLFWLTCVSFLGWLWIVMTLLILDTINLLFFLYFIINF